MKTYNERREVARRLREYEIGGTPIWFHVARAFGVPTTTGGREFFDMLAELIEPAPERTCCMEGPDPNRGRCTYCGAFVRRDAVADCSRVIPTTHCPNCGAKVVKR